MGFSVSCVLHVHVCAPLICGLVISSTVCTLCVCKCVCVCYSKVHARCNTQAHAYIMLITHIGMYMPYKTMYTCMHLFKSGKGKTLCAGTSTRVNKG